jgi:asparagine synthase (glutamine-hydrolysing)
VCGIVGIFDSRGKRAIDAQLLGRMNDAQTHRGPDADGIHRGPGIGLGHRRLSIIDLSGGAQPLYNEDGKVVVVFNGEIYNFQELVRELTQAGHRFKTHSDTEVIVHAWEQWGADCVQRFRGMFAFAVWDENRQTLFMARDRAGEKPLYYSFLPDGLFVFGSELKSLLAHPGVARKIDPQAIEDYFAYGYVPDPKSIYAGVAKLPPAHTLTLTRGRPPAEPQPYWNVSFEHPVPQTEAAAAEELVALLRQSVQMQMVADVPLGAFLSGGVDSSSVVAMMAETSRAPVNTCSIAFDHRGYDESHYAARVASRYRTNHHVKQVTVDDFELIDRLANMYDEPFADSSAMPTYRVCALARERVTVALSGDGGDELFAGYRRYRWHHYEELVRGAIPGLIRRMVFGPLAWMYPKADWAPRVFRAKATLQGIARNTIDAYFHSVSILPDGVRRQLFSAEHRSNLQGYNAVEVLRRHMTNAPTDDHLSQVQYADLKTYLPGDILTKVDRASMARSLEVRVPLLDHYLIEWAARLPMNLKLRGGEGKHIFKQAMRPYLDDDILYRRKMGFAVPLSEWFRGPLRGRVHAAVSGAALGDSGLFDMAYLGQLVDQHQSGRRDNSTAMWALLMFDSFLRQVHERGSAAAAKPRPELPELVS